jgi:hypothetical protein
MREGVEDRLSEKVSFSRVLDAKHVASTIVRGAIA